MQLKATHFFTKDHYMDNFIKEVIIKLNSYYSQLISIMPKLILAFFFLILFLTVMYFIRKIIVKKLFQNVKDQLLTNFLNKVLRTINILLGIIIFASLLGKTGIAAGFFGAAGVSAFVIGFAFKDIGENFLAGILMAVNRPFSIGDIISTQNVEGKIIGLNLRETIIKTSDGIDVFIPNSQILNSPLFNHTVDGFLRQEFEIFTTLNVKVEQVIELMLGVLNANSGVLKSQRKPSVSIKKLNVDNIEFKINFWIDLYDSSVSVRDIKNTLIQELFTVLRKHGIYEALEEKNS